MAPAVVAVAVAVTRYSVAALRSFAAVALPGSYRKLQMVQQLQGSYEAGGADVNAEGLGARV